MIVVVDASVTISWIAQDERSDYARAALAAIGGDVAVVPPIWQWEIANVLLVLERKKRLGDALAAYSRMMLLPIEIERSDERRSVRAILEFELARKHHLTIYDAAYLAAAKAAARPLATLDEHLAKAARAESIAFERD